MSSSDQCAVRPNGEPLDASEIQFYNDVDDDVPLPPVSDEISTPAAGQATLQQYFRRSERPRKQSSRLMNTNNAEAVNRKANDAEDAPPRGMKSRPKAELTKDIQPLFMEDEILNPDTGLRVKGHWCLLCKKDKVPQKKCFLLGNGSSRRTHISRNPGHFLVYQRMCEKNNVPVHRQATPKDFFKDQDNSKQTTLDNFATKTPPFSSQGLLDYLVEMMVTEDDVHTFLLFLWDSNLTDDLKESDIPHRTKMREEILKRTEEAEERLRSKLETGDPFLGVTGHYIDAPADSPEDWSLKSEQLAYTPIEGNYSGDNLSRILVRTVDGYDLRDKVDIVLCMEHAVHLTAGHFISDVSPLSAKAVLARAKKLRKKLMAANPDMDDNELDVLLAGDNGEDDEDDDGGWDGDNDDVDGPTPRDAVGKALALIKQAVNRFVLLDDDSTEVPNLVKKSYSNFRLSTRDWEQLIKMREVLQEPANIQQSFSSSRHPTVWRTLPLLEALAETWRNMAATEKFVDMQDSINASLDNLEKWYGKTDDTDVYFICLMLDPNIKTAYAEESWNSVAFEEGMAKLEAMVRFKSDSLFTMVDHVA
ncbi:hypothetical protein B0H10DRAFT_1937605 [Mycena sp. CBHHK59/15]|nr:hypothetical protein B0H10DRAFT_1937605 [Mycena sp. CBHHK59/15]